jgi:hypothetical protein
VAGAQSRGASCLTRVASSTVVLFFGRLLLRGLFVNMHGAHDVRPVALVARVFILAALFGYRPETNRVVSFFVVSFSK